MFLTELCNPLDELFVERENTALALDHLHHDRAAGLVRFCGYIRQVICLRIVKTFREREKILVELLLSGCL